jgi:outer membrane biosynthesis protein TonB
MANDKSVLLKITGPDGATRDQELTLESIIIGSGAAANVRIDDEKVSSIHAMLKVGAKGEVSVIDLNSEAGTKLGGKPVQEAALASGDVLELGRWRVRIMFGDSAATEVVKPEKAPAPPEPRKVAPAPAPVVAKPAPAPAPVAVKPPEKKQDEKLAAVTLPTAAKADRQSEATGSRKHYHHVHGRGAPASLTAQHLFDEDLPAEERPTEAAKVLEVVMLWGDTVIEASQFEKGKTIKVGGHRFNDFHLQTDLLPSDPFLLGATGSAATNIHVPSGCRAVMKSGHGAGQTEKTVTSTVSLGLEDRVLVEVGGVRFVARYVKPTPRLVSTGSESIDFYFVKVLSGSFMIFLILLAMMFVTPLTLESLSDDLFKNPSKYAHLIIKPPEQDKKKKVDLSGIKEGAKAKGDEGKFGKKEAKKQDADPSKKGSPIVNANKREEDRKKVLAAGLLGALGGMEGAASNILGPGGLGTGINNAFGGIKGGSGMGDAHGVGGLGSRGTGPGGGGTALGIGGLGTKGTGRGSGGYGSIDLGGHGKGMTRIIPGKTTVVGALSREEIERVIKRHQNEIKFCYEVELQKDPNLYGTVQITWTIDGAGSVTDADVSQTTMNNSGVEGCIASRIKRWKFPEPKGGGQVVVTYPWVFKAAGVGGDD